MNEYVPVQPLLAGSPSLMPLVTPPGNNAISPGGSERATPAILSPTSGKTGFLEPRQLRPPKSPLYVPAVLRPTEMTRRKSSRQSPLTPPQSVCSFSGSGSNTSTPLQSPAVMAWSTNGDSMTLEAISKFEMGLLGLGKVTASPSKNHWKDNSEANVCDDASCTRSFTYFTRRHHCRRCGFIFCDEHSTYTVPLDQHANYHPLGAPSRACEYCSKEYRAWEFLRSSNPSSESSQDDQPSTPLTPNAPLLPCSPFTPIMNCAPNQRGFFPPPGSSDAGSVANLGSSVPRDWNWSTF